MKRIGNVWKFHRRDGCLVTIQGPPRGAGKQVWQVNHGTQSARARNWFETKAEALAFARHKAVACNEWEDIYIVSYPERGAMRFRGQLLGHKNAERC